MKERILEYVNSLGISVRSFESECGLLRGNISNMSKTGAIGSDKLTKIHVNFPELNLEWLLTGEGSMLKSDSGNTVGISEEKLISNLIKEGKVMYCSEHDRQIKYKDAVIAELNQEIGKLKTLLEQNGIKQTGTLG